VTVGKKTLAERLEGVSRETQNILWDAQKSHREMKKHHEAFIEEAARTRVLVWQLRQLGLSHNTLALALDVTPSQIHKVVLGYARTGHDTPRSKRG